MALVGAIFNNPSFISIIKNLYHDPLMAEYLNNTPEIKRLKEKNPIFKEVLAKPELMDKLFTPELFNTFSQMLSIIDKDKENNNKNNEEINNNLLNQQKDMNKILNMNFENVLNNNNNLLNQQKDMNNIMNNNNMNFENEINNNINLNEKKKSEDSKNNKYHDRIIQLKELGFKNEKLIKQALKLSNGNLEEAIEILTAMDANT